MWLYMCMAASACPAPGPRRAAAGRPGARVRISGSYEQGVRGGRIDRSVGRHLHGRASMRQGAGAGFPISASPRGWFIINSPEESCVLLSDPRAPQWHEWIARARAAAGGGRPQRGSVCLHAGTLKTFHLYDAQRRFITAIHLCQTVFIIVYGFFNKPSPMAKFMPRSSFFLKKNFPSPPCWFGKFLNPV